MAYIDGIIAAVPEGGREAFLDHARRIDPLFIEFGATRVVEGWGDDVKPGKLTDFYRAVNAEPGETVIYSWIEWPNKQTRDAGMAKLMTDERMSGPMPFDGKRMIFGGFEVALELKP